MKIIFLGTNGWYDTAESNTVCALIKAPRWDIVLDAGNGISKLHHYTDGKKPVFVFLSHFHLDHIGGLHTLARMRGRTGPLTLCGQRGARKLLGRFINKPFTVPLKDLPFPVNILELPSEAGKLPFGVKTLPLVHADPVIGLRLQLGRKSVAYITDTGYCPNALTLARGADLLLTECAHAPGETNPHWPHFNPETAGRLAAEAGVRKYVMTHFSADRYPTRGLRARALKIARGFFPGALAAKDGLEVDF